MKINCSKKSEIEEGMFGLFFEDINYAADGGLYAELIENRSFEAKAGFGNPGTFYTVDDFGYAWSSLAAEGKEPVMQYVSGSPLSVNNPHYLRITTNTKGQGFINKAYDGICVKAGEKLNVTFYARAVRYEGNITVAIMDKEGKKIVGDTLTCMKAKPFKCFADLTVDIDDSDGELNRINSLPDNEYTHTSDWVKYETTLVAPEDLEKAVFAISLDELGVVEFDFISVIPGSAVAGIFRKDIFDVLKDMKPGFVRFPGGCIVEGISLLNRYQWKTTVGPTIDRTYIPNLWAFDDDGSKTDLDAHRADNHYGQSFGIGFYEYFLLCELIGAKPLPVLNMGAACQFRSTQLVDTDSLEFEEYVKDALDLIEFANGPIDSKWGALRASMGHPESFKLEFIAVGNEQWMTHRMDVFDRNDRFEKAIRKVYKDIKILGTAGPVVDMPMCNIAWDYYREGAKKDASFCYAVDEHYYKSPEWMYENINLYNDYEGIPYVFAGEYASHTPNRDNSMVSALSEAAFMTGLEINAGVVKLASYAPLFNRIGHSQWRPDMIWFDEKEVFLTPNYHVQSLYMNNLGTHTLEFTDEMKSLRDKGIYISASTDGNDTILKIVNTTDEAFTLPIEDENGKAIVKEGIIKTLTGDGVVPKDMPEKSSVEETTLSINGSVTLKEKSFSVLRYKAN